ncbi:hypothetical protein [Streptomyces sp. NPDC000983]|uniref:hypothetical protein n=1 Tax=Streptomyces sp. NPDC000983 TaxID=3154373 RepID=UPI003316B477
MRSASTLGAGCCLAVLLVPLELLLVYLGAAVLVFGAHPAALAGWMLTGGLLALGAGAWLLRRGHLGLGAAQTAAALLVLSLTALGWIAY